MSRGFRPAVSSDPVRVALKPCVQPKHRDRRRASSRWCAALSRSPTRSGEFGVGDLLRYVEDNDEPVTAHADIEEELAELKGRVDPQDEDPAVMMAIAVATYLAFRRDELSDDPGDILRMAARAEYDGNPPDNVRGWLEEQGVPV